MLSEWLLILTEYLALVATAMSGAFVAIDKRLDMIGVWFLSLVASFGGGVLRDLLLGNTPPIFFTHYHWLLLVTVISMAVFCVARFWRGWWRPRVRLVVDRVHNVLDAVGLAAFTVSGVQLAVAAGHAENPVLCVFMGTITGIGGGVLRDITVLRMPAVLYKRIYAVAAIAGAVLYWLCLQHGVRQGLAWALAMASIMAIRMFATIFRWNLPRVPVPEEQQENNEEKETIVQ